MEWSLQIRERDQARDKSRIFKGGWSPGEAEERACPGGGTNPQGNGFLQLLFLLLGGCRGLVLGPEREACGISGRMGFADEEVEVAGEIIHHRPQLEQ